MREPPNLEFMFFICMITMLLVCVFLFLFLGLINYSGLCSHFIKVLI